MIRIRFIESCVINISITAIVLFFRGPAVSGCGDVQVLSDLVRRARNYKADGVRGSDPFIEDRYISPEFYSVTNEKGQYLMPDKDSMPDYGVCGTQQPIYLKDTHPDITGLTNDPIDVVACERSPFSPCENERQISIRKCGDEIQYYLQQTSQNSAYCFDPPELTNVTDIENAPDVVLGEMSVNPKLDFYDFIDSDGNTFKGPNIIFECKETPYTDRSSELLIFSTYWFIDNELRFPFERKNNVSLLIDTDLTEKGIKLGINIRCGIRVSSSITGMQTDMKSSADFFAGVKIHNKIIHMDKDEVATVLLEQTVPYGCYSEINQNFTCEIGIQMKLPDSSKCELGALNSGNTITLNYVKDIHAKCGAKLTGFLHHETSDVLIMPNKTMTVTTQYISDSDPEKSGFALITQNGGHLKIWKNVDLGFVTIIITNNDKFTEDFCYSHVDPHMKTRDGERYENNDSAGEFILYRNLLYGTEVQEKTVSCWGDNVNPFCTCAVAVRSGGDVFLINLCPNNSNYIGMTSCKDKGAILVEKKNAFEYKVQTSIGTLVYIRIRPHPGYYNLMNVDIHMAPKDYKQTVGLCGTYDGNTYNDFHKRDRTITNRIEFIKQWRIGPNDVNMLYKSCDLGISSWTEQGNYPFCICNCFENQPCQTPHEEVYCGPSQYVNCTTDMDSYIQSDLCMEFERKCNTSFNNIRKRSASAVNSQHEMKRKATLARTEPEYIFKRETGDETSNITEEDAKNLCTEKLETNPIVVQHSNLLRGFNVSHAIEDCTYDVFTSQDTGWIEGHQSAISAAVKIGFERNANYTSTHSEELLEFLKQSCPSNCNSRGNCSDKGTCQCESGYFGPDCSKNISQGPEIDDIEGGGFCDIQYDSECRCFDVQVDLLAEEYYCKLKYQIQQDDGQRRTISTNVVQGLYKNFFTGECCFDAGRVERSDEAITGITVYMYDVSLSNDGENFGETTALYIYDSSCLTPITSGLGNTSFVLQDNTCMINGYCYNKEDIDLNDECMKCIPSTSQFNWTKVCTDDNPKTTESSIHLTPIIVPVIVVVVLSLSVFVFCLLYKKSENSKRMVTPSHSFMSLREKEDRSEVDRYRENALQRFKSQSK